MVLIASAVAGYVVFGIFVAAFVVLAVISVRWAVRRDRAGRAEWVRRQREASGGADAGRRAGGPGARRGGPRSGR